MNKYLFQTTVTMKPYNRGKWWIDGHIVRDFISEADNINKALDQYREHAKESCVYISNNALKAKEPMYIDNADGEAVQIGYVVTGTTELWNDVKYTSSTQYIDMWITVKTVIDTKF